MPGMTLIVGIIIGVALGLLVVAFAAIGSYDRGYDAALRVRRSPAYTAAPTRRPAPNVIAAATTPIAS